MSPVYNPAPAVLDLLQVDPDPNGDWLRVGNGPWQRIRIFIIAEGKSRYMHEVRLPNGDTRSVGFSDWPD